MRNAYLEEDSLFDDIEQFDSDANEVSDHSSKDKQYLSGLFDSSCIAHGEGSHRRVRPTGYGPD